MSQVTVTVDGDEPTTEPVAAPADDHVDAAPPVPQVPASSLLGQLDQEVADQVDNATKVLPVGKTQRLRARYRALTNDEQDRIEKQVQNAAKLRKKTGQNDSDIDRQNDSSALLLATACVELLWVTDDGSELPLHELLAAPDQLGDQAPPGPLRYDRATFDLLRPARAAEMREQLGRDLNAVDVAKELHRWGPENHSPLRTYGRLLNLWMSGVSAEALAEVSEGN